AAVTVDSISGSAPFTLEINGSGFGNGSSVVLDQGGVLLPLTSVAITVVSSSKITMQFPVGYFTSGNLQQVLISVTSGSATSNAVTLSLQLATTQNPSVLTTIPTNGTSGVSIHSGITVVFDKEMNAASFSGGNFQLTDGYGVVVAGTLGYSLTTNSSTIAHFQPLADLYTNANYTLNIGAVADIAGNTIANYQTISFTTEPYAAVDPSLSINMGFEQYSFAGFTALGDAQLVGSAGESLPTEGAQMALISTTGTSVASKLSSITSGLIVVPTGAKALVADLSISSYEYPAFIGSKFDDVVFASIVGTGISRTDLVTSVNLAPWRQDSYTSAGTTGFVPWVFDLGGLSSPYVSVQFDVSNVGDTAVATLLAIDNLRFVPSAIAVSPALTEVPIGTPVQFQAAVIGSSSGVVWQVNGIDGGNATLGTIDSYGLYTPPATAPANPQLTISAYSQLDPAVVGKATVLVSGPITLTVNPYSADVLVGKSLNLSATVAGTINKSVTWTHITGNVGSLLPSGSGAVFTAPAQIASSYQQVQVEVVSKVDQKARAIVDIRVLADSDGDGVADLFETNTGIYVSPTDTGTSPFVADSDGDGISDGIEVQNGLNPLVKDLPIVTPPVSTTVPATTPSGASVNDPSVQKFLNGASATASYFTIASLVNDAPTTLPVGATTVTFTAVDSYGNVGSAISTLTVSPYLDAIAPIVTPPAAIMVIAQDVYGAPSTDPYIAAFLAGATATDNVGVVSQYNNAPTQFPLGRTTVTFSATDSAGNLGTATSFVDVYTYINGVLAAGRPVAGGTLTVHDLYGHTVTATADIYGNYNLYAQLTPPLLLQVDRYGLPSLFSLSLDVGTAHVTTLTTMITARALQAANKAQIIANFANPYGAALTPADLYSATSQLKSLLGLTAFTQLGGKSPLNDPNFKADGTGMDAVMDALSLKERDEDGDGTPDLVLASRSATGGAIIKLLAANPLALLRDIYSFSLSGAALLGDDLYGTAFTENDVITSPYNRAPLITSGTITPQTALGYSREALNLIIPTLLAGAEAQGVDLYASRSQLVQYVERVLTNLRPAQNAGLAYDDQLQGSLIQNDSYAFVGVVDSYGVITNPILAADTLTQKLDSDGDGISNAAESTFGSNPNVVEVDHDGDGIWTRTELALGSDPLLATDRPRVAAFVGQLDGNGAALSNAIPNDGGSNDVGAYGLQMPQGMDIDPVRHRLFVADKLNARVLVFQLDASNSLASRRAIAVLGQADFDHIDSNGSGVASNSGL
ncbi:MAG: Ig-like domain-containing protein, partial [Mariprofundales bacterium]|nr:Ig-like domain-containing protein [Mariprofundales bacterium]